MLLTHEEIKEYIKKGLLVQDLIDKKVQIQQCGVDITAGKVFGLKGTGVLDFSNEKRKLPEYKEIEPENDSWHLNPGVYHLVMNERIVLPNNIAGLLLPRSSALTCGLEVHTAVWDPGYTGRSFIHASVVRDIILYKNARVAQMIFFMLAKPTKPYDGKYKGEDLLENKKRGLL
jgi:dUTP pyrophosphatase